MSQKSWSDVVREREDAFERAVVDAMRQLMQGRHMYQSIVIPNHIDKYLLMKDGKNEQHNQGPPAALGAARVCVCRPPDLKLFCQHSRCDRVEAFNLVYAKSLLGDLGGKADFQTEKGESEQKFVFGYQCQSCKGTPEFFLIHRRGLRLTLEGRSPMEHVAVPAVIPKSFHRFYVGAVIAHQSGHTLSGIFMLRTLIEQWARQVTGSTKRDADQVMEAYMETLPKDFSDRFPSMRKLYAELSADIHGAVGAPELFDRGRQIIDEHFDARRLFRLADKAAGPPAAVASEKPELSA